MYHPGSAHVFQKRKLAVYYTGLAIALCLVVSSQPAKSEIDPTSIQQAVNSQEMILDQMCSSEDPVACSPISLQQTSEPANPPQLEQPQVATNSKRKPDKGITEEIILHDIQTSRMEAFRDYADTLAAYAQVFATGNTVEVPAGLDPSLVKLVSHPENAPIVAYDFVVSALRHIVPPPYLNQIQAYVGF